MISPEKLSTIAHYLRDRQIAPGHHDALAMLEEIERLTSELDDYKEDRRTVMAESCSGATDLVHCTCVPGLRGRVQDAEKLLATLTSAVASSSPREGYVVLEVRREDYEAARRSGGQA